MKVRVWVEAMRLRTLPLAISSVGVGSFLGYMEGAHSLNIFILLCTTTILLQILSNLANDYGDSTHGADSDARTGPARAVQSGEISSGAMLRGIIVFVLLSLISGLSLLKFTVGLFTKEFYYFLALGLLSIVAAITYTVGRKPYGYAGLGDISVLVFFGFIGVGGGYYLQVAEFNSMILLPAFSLGFFSVAVLNINNIRDIVSDKLAGKNSIPVRIGRESAENYHIFLLLAGMASILFFTIINHKSYFQYLYILSFPLFGLNAYKVKIMGKQGKTVDALLKQLALSVFAFAVLFCLGLFLTFK